MLKKEVNLWMNQSLLYIRIHTEKMLQSKSFISSYFDMFSAHIDDQCMNLKRGAYFSPWPKSEATSLQYRLQHPKGSAHCLFSRGQVNQDIFGCFSLLSVRSVVVRTMNEQMSQVNIIAKFELKHSPSALKPGLLVSGGTAHPRVVLGKTGLKKSWGYQVDRVNCVGARFGCKSFPCILSPCPKPLHTSVISLPVCTFTFLPRSKIYNEIRLACEVWCL